ncbi:MAG TPA: cardiolipin synthase [Burkholderiales bacterium]|nr:cardiolipin synthase [Burkholderiales bacterium]
MARKKALKRAMWPTVAAYAMAAALAAVLVLNLSIGDKKIDTVVDHMYGIEDAQFVRTIDALLGPPLVAGNRVTALLNGDQIFPAMLEAVQAAKRSITFEMYIYWSGEIGQRFADALSERAAAGVKVHVLIDGVGSGKIDEEYVEKMERAGVRLVRYNRPHWYTLGKLNNRTHRKLLVVDGTVGFTGGVGIADQWTGNAQDPAHWRDTHFRIEGPAVAQMQGAFMDNWIEETGAVLHGGAFFPPPQAAGDVRAQIFTSSPGGAADSMQLMYLIAIAAARKSIDLSAAYFVPDNVEVGTLVGALKRGVTVRIIVPGEHIDSSVVRRASRARWGDLLDAGAEIYEYQPTMFHCKVMVIDELWTSVGSTNFDNRSFAVNDEANLNIYDREFARQQVRVFEDDLRNSRRITREEWRNRPWSEKLWEQLMSLTGSQL